MYACPKRVYKEDDPNNPSRKYGVGHAAMRATTGFTLAKRDEWLVDSGALAHMSPSAEQLNDIEPVLRPSHVTTADSHPLPVLASGTTEIKTASNYLRLREVLHVPALDVNLL